MSKLTRRAKPAGGWASSVAVAGGAGAGVGAGDAAVLGVELAGVLVAGADMYAED